MRSCNLVVVVELTEHDSLSLTATTMVRAAVWVCGKCDTVAVRNTVWELRSDIALNVTLDWYWSEYSPM